MKKIVTLFLALVITLIFNENVFSQETKPKIDISGFIDVYYSYDFSNPNTATKLPFLYNYNRHNEFNVNIGLLRASVSYQNIYAKMSIHAGTYVDDNYAAEDLKILSEAYLGVFLNESKKTSLEAGILPSYIGFETATSHSNLTATRSILAENSPYFMTGIKLNHQFTDKVSGAFLMTNGWQRINK
ncbi:MAG: outer membrane beta-barrel protein, partial [Flavobacterium sp.]|nr:outer membrane beta-barrel protein [Flavobacterium sp.]